MFGSEQNLHSFGFETKRKRKIFIIIIIIIMFYSERIGGNYGQQLQ